MNAKKTFLYAGLPLLVIVSATLYHRSQRNSELKKQKAQKESGVVAVSLAQVESRPFRESIAFTGTLLAVNRAELRAEVPGRVTRVNVQEGDRVGAGAILCAQDEDDLTLGLQAAEAQLAQAQVQAQQAERDNDRAQMLLEKRSITKQAAQQAETYFNASLAAVRAADSNLGLAKSRLKKARITSPIAGEVAARLIQPGEMLSPGQSTFVVVDNRQMEILADLPTETLGNIKPGLKATFKVMGFDQPFEGKVTQVSPLVQAEGRTLRIRLEVPNPKGVLKSGLFAEGRIEGQKEVSKPALPASILTLSGQNASVFVSEKGLAKQKLIQVGAEQNGWRSIEGLQVGQSVVGQGREHVMEGSRLKTRGQEN